jgi:galactokinase
MNIFVPGRLCLFGEHSDWAGGYRHLNPFLAKGYTLLVGTNQGIYAEVKPHPQQLIITASKDDSSRQTLTLPMNPEVLLTEAQKGGFFSYAAGVAYQISTRYQVDGVEIDNYLTDLPIQKGLSSSAAISVLVARAFNLLYDLKMSVREEMEFAYQGEITTPSRCGRMDQACAYGNRPVLMIFDGDRAEIIELKVSQDLLLVIVDLGSQKNTTKILADLNYCYPFATTEVERNVQHYLGSINSQITQAAARYIQQGDAEQIGILMTKAQAEFDRHLIPACLGELTAPLLHKILNYEPIQPYIWGGKGVGSQGDGAAQFIVKDRASQQKLIEIVERDFPAMKCLNLIIYGQKTSS